MAGELAARLAAELAQPVPPPVARLAAELAGRAGAQAFAVLYYGSTLRDDAPDGLLDFYILLDDVRAWPGSRWAQLANRLLPPNVGYCEGRVDGRDLRAKYAVLSVAQFRAGLSPRALDTTLWARFAQPCVCVWARGTREQAELAGLLHAAVVTAAHWAAVLGPARGDAGDYWRALFAHTYRAELRVEQNTRSDEIVSRHAERYAQLLPLAWQAGRLPFHVENAQLVPELDAARRQRERRRWARRERLGKPLNVLRLLKAALTFANAVDYVSWKVERHAGVRLELAPWQRRHPLLAAPSVYRQLRRRGVLR